ncbi:MAG TPA: M23 family metallopeptidase [Thermoanaerobaculia bacterium]|nr:M23 family metallopeptidase [Thermoanaerobaculia bacterium]
MSKPERPRRRPSLGTSAGPPPGPWIVEVQIHPADARKRVRYLFLSRVGLTVASVLILGYLFLVSLGTALARDVWRAIFGNVEIRTLTLERMRQGDRLEALVGELGALEQRTKGLRIQLAELRLAYGLPVRRPEVLPPPPEDDESIYGGAITQGERIRAVIERHLAALDRGLAEVRAFEAAHPAEVGSVPSRCPLEGEDLVLITPFGNHRNPFTKELEFHPGVDFAAPEGTRVNAAADGVVAFAGQVPLGRSPTWYRLGQVVVLRHGDAYATVYGQLDRSDVRPGQQVRRGEQVGAVGRTGWALAPQLHFEVRRRNREGELAPVDPRIYMFDRHWRDEESLLVRATSNPWAPRGSWEPAPGVR